MGREEGVEEGVEEDSDAVEASLRAMPYQVRR
jgi:hypothetical protein